MDGGWVVETGTGQAKGKGKDFLDKSSFVVLPFVISEDRLVLLEIRDFGFAFPLGSISLVLEESRRR